MLLKKWELLPDSMKNSAVKPYYDILKRKTAGLVLKRAFDIAVSFVMLVLLSPFFLILALAIKLDSPGPVFFRQVRVTAFGEKFRIFKFRTMVADADKKGTQVTGKNDSRITRVGNVIRKLRLDEISQLIDVLRGKMTFVGVRPEVPKYVESYTPEMMATLLLPAGITSLTSIYYKDESSLLDKADDIDRMYVEEILPDKMRYNLMTIKKFSFFSDIKIMFMTVFAMFGKEYSEKTEK